MFNDCCKDFLLAILILFGIELPAMCLDDPSVDNLKVIDNADMFHGTHSQHLQIGKSFGEDGIPLFVLGYFLNPFSVFLSEFEIVGFGSLFHFSLEFFQNLAQISFEDFLDVPNVFIVIFLGNQSLAGAFTVANLIFEAELELTCLDIFF